MKFNAYINKKIEYEYVIRNYNGHSIRYNPRNNKFEVLDDKTDKIVDDFTRKNAAIDFVKGR